MIAELLKARSHKVSKEELQNYEKKLVASTYSQVKEKYDEQAPLFADSITETVIPEGSGFEFNGGDGLAGKTFSQIEEENY